MIAPLRRWHRRATAAIVIAVPAVFVAAIVARPGVPVNARLPIQSESTPVTSRPLAWSRGDVVASLVKTGDGGAEVAFDTRSLSLDPDVLVYWFEPGDSGEPPAAGKLLGAIRGNVDSRIALPSRAAEIGGRLALYSLAHDEVFATTKIEAQGGPA